MKIRLTLPALLLALAAPFACADESEATLKAQDAAQAWLTLTDTARFAQSWNESAMLFQAAITQQDWEKAIARVRTPLGALQSRTLKSAVFTRTLPGAPDGEYVVIQYQAKFANKAAAIETVTPMHEKDGSWRVSGYFVK